MQASHPDPPVGLNVAGATYGQTLIFDGTVFRPADVGGGGDGAAPMNFASSAFSLSLPAGATKAIWSFAATCENGSHEVCNLEGYINAWKTTGMSDIHGEVVLAPSTIPGWAAVPDLEGGSSSITVTLNPTDGTWRTTLRLLRSAA